MSSEQPRTFYLNILTAWNCSRRRLDAQRVHDYMLTNGYTEASRPQDADFVILSSCAYLQEKEDRSVRLLHHYANRVPSGSSLVVLGCLPDISPERIRQLEYTHVPVLEMDRIDNIMPHVIPMDDIPDPTHSRALIHSEPVWIRLITEFRPSVAYLRQCLRWFARSSGLLRHNSIAFTNRPMHLPEYADPYTIRLGDGCASSCAYCVIRQATGRVRSKPINEIITTFQAGLSDGHDIFEITMEDVGAYGIDSGTSIVALLSEIFSIPGDYKLIVKYFNARWLIRYIDDLIPLLAANYHKIAVLQVPIESGSDAVLRAMKRGYTSGQVKDSITRIMEAAPNINLTTHFVVGFPGEGNREFFETRALIKDLKLRGAEFFAYSEHQNARSAALSGKVTPKEIRRRCIDLEDLVVSLRKKAR